MKKYLIGILGLMIIFVLTSCSFNGTQLIADQLKPNELIEIFNTTPPNLAALSKCSSPASVWIVNTETNDQNYNIYTFGSTDAYITPKKLVDNIVIYMSDAFNRTGIKTDKNSKNVIQVSLEKMKSSYGFFNYSADTQLKITLPEKKFTQIYNHSDSTPKGAPKAVAYTLHEIVWKVINDPIVKDYLLCTSKNTKDESPVGETALEILKKRYVNGEITKDQFERIKNDIQ